MTINIGADVHSKSISAYAIPTFDTESEELEYCEEFNIRFGKFRNDYESLSDLANFVRDTEHGILIENTGFTNVLYWTLTNMGCTVIVALPTDLYEINQSKQKTDANDARKLANYMRRRTLGETPFAECLMVDSVWMNRKLICRNYMTESNILSDTRRQLRSYILLKNLKPGILTNDIASATSLASLSQCADKPLLLLITRAKDTRKRMDKVLEDIEEEFSDEPMYESMKSIKGFGPVVSAYLCSMVIDIKRFRTPNQFAAYFGIVPGQRESAESSPHCKITRRGDATARHLLLRATMLHIQFDKDRESTVSQMYDRLKGRGFPTKKAYMACTNKMAHRLFSVLNGLSDGKEV